MSHCEDLRAAIFFKTTERDDLDSEISQLEEELQSCEDCEPEEDEE
jgi:hypothetical protein